MARVGYYNRCLQTILTFREEHPEGYKKLDERMNYVKAGRIFTTEQYRTIFDILLEKGNIKETMDEMKIRGIVCSSPASIEKVITVASHFIRKYENQLKQEFSRNNAKAKGFDASETIAEAFRAKSKLEEITRFLQDHKGDDIPTKDILAIIEKD